MERQGDVADESLADRIAWGKYAPRLLHFTMRSLGRSCEPLRAPFGGRPHGRSRGLVLCALWCRWRRPGRFRSGTARADFPGGDARQLWRSIQRILQLPSETRLFTGHDYRPNGLKARWESNVAAQRTNNLHLKNSDEAKFVRLRTERDRSLPMPALILPALQVNLSGGRLPAPEADGRRYLNIPLNTFPHASWGELEPEPQSAGIRSPLRL